jgi:hypothetical protein
MDLATLVVAISRLQIAAVVGNSEVCWGFSGLPIASKDILAGFELSNWLWLI